MKPTREEFIEALRSFNVPWINRVIDDKKQTLPRIVDNVVIYCFMNKIPENEATEMIRHQLKSLWDVGNFDFRQSE